MHTTATKNVVSYISSRQSVWDYLSFSSRKEKKEEKMSNRTAVHCIIRCRREEKEARMIFYFSLSFRLTSMCCRSLYFLPRFLLIVIYVTSKKRSNRMIIDFNYQIKLAKRVLTPTHTYANIFSILLSNVMYTSKV